MLFSNPSCRSHRPLKAPVVLLISLFIASVQAADIVALEYFIGDDPGQGAGKIITVAQPGNPAGVTATVSAADLELLPAGMHTITCRSLDSDGAWSIGVSRPLLIQPAESQQINQLEYFTGAEPGPGNGSIISFTPSSPAGSISPTINAAALAALPTGPHTLTCRVRTGPEEHWGHPATRTFIKENAILSPDLEITGIEYFAGNDPGPGQGLAGTLPGEGSVVTAASGTLPPALLGSLPDGIHQISCRVISRQQVWTPSITRTFLKESPLPDGLVTGVEWAWLHEGASAGEGLIMASPPATTSLLSGTTTVSSLADRTLYHLLLTPVDSNGRRGFSAALPVYMGLGDGDNDGTSDGLEFLAGTNPDDPSDLLKIESVTMQSSGPDSNQLRLNFPSVAGKRYRIERSESLTGNSWISVRGNIPATADGGPPFHDIVLPACDRCFFRIAVEPVPLP